MSDADTIRKLLDGYKEVVAKMTPEAILDAIAAGVQLGISMGRAQQLADTSDRAQAARIAQALDERLRELEYGTTH